MMITSLDNSRIKEAIKLRDRRPRKQKGLFLIEGYRELSRAVEAGQKIVELFICAEFFLGSNEPHLIEQIRRAGAAVCDCAPHVFAKLSYRDRPDGLLAVATQTPTKLSEWKLPPQAEAPFFVVAEAIEKPGNLGTILRCADAAGAHGVIVTDPCTDIYNPNVVRASVGTLFTVPTIEAPNVETLAWLKQQGVALIAATPEASRNYTDVDYRGAVAIVLGTEQLGLTQQWREAATQCVRIPMHGVADSLNVAMAATLMFYEVRRQRGWHR